MNLKLVDDDPRRNVALLPADATDPGAGLCLDEIDRATADLAGDPPAALSAAFSSLGPYRRKFANYVLWRQSLLATVDGLLAKQTELDAAIAAPAQTVATIKDAVARTAAWLLGRASDNPGEAQRKTLDDQLIAQRHRAEAATVARAELEAPLKLARLRLAKLVERENEFVGPAICELADQELGLGVRWRRAVKELQEVNALLSGVAQVARGFGSGFEARPATIQLPRYGGLPSLAHAAPAEFTISDAAANTAIWRTAIERLWRDPKSKASEIISLK